MGLSRILSDGLENQLLNLINGQSATAPVTPPLRLALVTAVGSDSAAGTEVTGGSYSRKTVTFTSATGGQAQNSNTMSFTGMPACTVVGFEVYDSAATPKMLWRGQFSSPRVVTAGQTVEIASGSIVVRFDLPVENSHSPYDTLVLSDNPVRYWPVDGTGSELTGSGHALTYSGSPATTTLGTETVTVFNGTSQYAQAADSNVLSIPTTGLLTVEAWIRPDTLEFPADEETGYVHFIGKGEGAQDEWAGRMYSYTNTESPPRPNRISFYAFNLPGNLGTGSYFQGGINGVPAISAGEWVHVAAVYNIVDKGGSFPNGYVEIFRNGVSMDKDDLNSTTPVTPANGTAPLRIGTRDFASYFKGAIGKVAIYDYVVPPARLLAHAQGTNPSAPVEPRSLNTTFSSPTDINLFPTRTGSWAISGGDATITVTAQGSNKMTAKPFNLHDGYVQFEITSPASPPAGYTATWGVDLLGDYQVYFAHSNGQLGVRMRKWGVEQITGTLQIGTYSPTNHRFTRINFSATEQVTFQYSANGTTWTTHTGITVPGAGIQWTNRALSPFVNVEPQNTIASTTFLLHSVVATGNNIEDRALIDVPTTGSLLADEQFNNLDNWSIDHNTAAGALISSARTTVENGELHLRVASGMGSRIYWFTVPVSRYGRYRFRLKYNRNTSSTGAAVMMWSRPDNWHEGEFDVYEGSATESHTTMHSFPQRPAYSPHDVSPQTVVADMTQYHIYDVDWRPNYVACWFDGKLNYVTFKPSEVMKAPMDIRIHNRFQDSVYTTNGGPGPTGSETADLTIDYIQVFSNPNTIPVGTGTLTVGSPSVGTGATVANGGTVTWSHTIQSANLLVVCTSATKTGATQPVAGVTYGGVAMTRWLGVTSRVTGDPPVADPASTAEAAIWILWDPPVGTANVVVTAGASGGPYTIAGSSLGVAGACYSLYGLKAGRGTAVTSLSTSGGYAANYVVVGVVAARTTSALTLPTGATTLRSGLAGTDLMAGHFRQTTALPTTTSTVSWTGAAEAAMATLVIRKD